MIELRYRDFNLPLKHTFTISRGSADTQRTLIVQLTEADVHGYGEATTNAYYGATLDSMAAAIERVRPLLESASTDDLDSLVVALHQELATDRADLFALCALDLALHDLWGKRRGEPLYSLWGLSTATAPDSCYTIGIDTTEKMVAKMLEMDSWPIYKIKLGTDYDIEIIEELRRHTSAIFRVDANCGWTAQQTIDFSVRLKELGVEFIEQPLQAEDAEGASVAYAGSALPLLADESCVIESDVDACHGLFHGVNVKLVKCGGLAPARRMIARAKQLGMETMVGCMTESTVGISAIAQLAPMLDYVDMDGAELLASDIAIGVRLDHGRILFPNTPGSGVSLIEGPWGDNT